MNIPSWFFSALEQLQAVILIYFLAVNLFYLILFVISLWAIIGYLRRISCRNFQEILKSRETPPISILVPAHNEAATIVSNVKSLLHLNYPELEIIVINDGSADETLQKLIAAFKLRKTKRVYNRVIPTKNVRDIYASDEVFPWIKLIVIDKEKGGKADALNAGLNTSRYPLFCSVDADSILERDSLLRVVMPFMENFQGMIGVGGIVRVANGCAISQGIVSAIRLPSRWLPRIQAVEYLRAFLSGRIAWSKLRSLLIVSGAFGLFKKAPVMDMKGYDTTTVGEDMELVVRLHHFRRQRGRKCNIELIPDPVCWTEVPEKFRTLWRQRNRWQRGLSQALYKHKTLFFNPKYGILGLLTAPYFLLVELLSPLVELLGYFIFLIAVLLGVIQWEAFAAFFILAVLMGINLSLLAILLEEFTLHRYSSVRDLMRLFGAAVIENLGYRQIVNLARLEGIVDFLRNQTAWGVHERTGLDANAS